MLDNKVNNSSQEHKYRNLIYSMHGTKVKITFAARVFFTEKVRRNFREIK